MKILVLGSGAREHAIITALHREGGHEIVVSPGNAGMTDVAQRIRMSITDPELVADFVKEEQFDLVVIGPEAPLVAGVSDAVRALGVPVFGPSQSAAAIEGSKAFAKDIMQRANVPTGRGKQCQDIDELISAIDEFGAPYVVKADGLASGKGVIVTEDRGQAIRHAEQWIVSGPLLVEEFLDGHEVSLFCFSDGEAVRALPPAQDFKRLHDGDHGPNTGGMGAYTPVPFLSDRFGSEQEFVAEAVRTVAQPVIDTLRADGNLFQGLLYCGLIVTAAGIRVIEFNARFGDPETQVVLERLGEPLSALLLACANGTLHEHPEQLAVRDNAAVTVVIAAEGYPEHPVTGLPIGGLDDAAAAGALVLHAGTATDDNDELVVSGGRVLSVVATGDTIADARRVAYTAAGRIELEGAQYRSDIAQLGAALQDSQRALTQMTQPAAETAQFSDTPIAAATARATGFVPAADPLADYRHVYSGKVREIYESDDALLLVASNRVSAFDHLLEPEIPGKGAMLTQLSRWWFDRLDVPNHLREPEGWDAQLSTWDAARTMRVAKLEMFPIECVVRGYLTGSGLKEYEATGAVCGVPLSEGLRDGDRLPEPIFTPAYKAPQGEHDENINFERVVELIGEDDARALRELSLQVYRTAAQIALEHGLVLADTKFEFGRDPETGAITLADEVLTSDSSRYWDADAYADETAGLDARLASFDKQIVRSWLRDNWDGEGTPPVLPAEVVERTRERYAELLQRLGVPAAAQ